MKILILVSILVLSLRTDLSFAEDASIVAKSERSVVRVIVFDSRRKLQGLGSGFAIGGGEIIVTNFHVVTNGERVFVVGKGSSGATPKREKGTVFWSSQELDLAFIRLESGTFPPLKVATDLVKKGDRIFALGYPGAADIAFESIDASLVTEATLTNGTVGRLLNGRWVKEGAAVEIIQHSAPINGGNSGGPLFDLCGRVVGINTAKAVSFLDKGSVDATTGIHFASGSSAILSGLNLAKLVITTDGSTCSPGPLGTGATGIESPVGVSDLYKLVGFAAFGVALLLGAFIYIRGRTRQASMFPISSVATRSNNSVASSQVLRGDSSHYYLEGSDSSDRPVRLSASIGAKVVYIGRSEGESQLILSDSTVSRRHASLVLTDGVLWLQDCESKNGTFINGERLSGAARAIVDGDKVRLGRVILRLRRGSA
jgi:hypothetical protein